MSAKFPRGGSKPILSHPSTMCYLCLVFVMRSCLFIAALWSPEGKGLTSDLFVSIPGPCCLSYFEVERLFLAVPWGCLRFMIVVFPDHAHLLFLKFQHLKENTIFDLNIKVTKYCPAPSTYDVAYAPATFEVANFKGLGDAFIRK